MSEKLYETEQEAAVRRIMDEAFPKLLVLLAELREFGREPSGLMLPTGMKPPPLDNPTPGRDFLMGLPVTWGDRLALIVDA